jgi:hypothetical protein
VARGYNNTQLEFNAARNAITLQDQRTFAFDQLFPPGLGQEDLYGGCNISHLVGKLIDGYHTTIFAYGQTASGKTYTIDGYDYTRGEPQPPKDPASLGVIPRAIAEVFSKIAERSKERTYSVFVSYMQLYNEKIYDLLNPAASEGLKLRWSQQDQFTVENLFVFECRTADELLRHFQRGLRQRVTAAHRLNMSSSRSHAILEVRLESFDNRNPAAIMVSKLEIVDLAGSERIGQTGAEGKQAKESIDINKSLFTLRHVINTLTDPAKAKKDFVPYRDSKLTSLLKQAIGGNSYCLMLACINPHDGFFEENVSTLTYATKTAYITNRPVRNDDPQTKLVSELKRQIAELSSELEHANDHIRLMAERENQLDSIPDAPAHY